MKNLQEFGVQVLTTKDACITNEGVSFLSIISTIPKGESKIENLLRFSSI